MPEHFPHVPTPRNLTDLLALALWDISEAYRLAAEALHRAEPRCRSENLRKLLRQMGSQAAVQSHRFYTLVAPYEGPQNLWVTGLIEDLLRDTETLPDCSIRDIAVVGAVRKLLRADMAALDTAQELARRTASEPDLITVEAAIRQRTGWDGELKVILARTCRHPVGSPIHRPEVDVA